MMLKYMMLMKFSNTFMLCSLRSFSLTFDRKGFAQSPTKGWRDEVSMEQN
jgi:hypothetical protein